MDKGKFQNIIGRYLAGKADGKEKQAIDRWYEGYPVVDDDEAFGNPERKAYVRTKLLEQIDNKLGRRPVSRRIDFRLVAIAATLLMVAAAAIWIYHANQHAAAGNNQFQELTTGMREVKKVLLPDSSIVWMNAHTTLRVPNGFGTGADRQVFLDDGEARFEVQGDEARPFSVHTPQLNVTVLGTVFNVRSYEYLPEVSVGVSSGKVRIGDSVGNQLAGAVTAGQQLVLDRGMRQVRLANIDETQGGGWHDGVVRLRDATIHELQLVLLSYFGVTLRVEDRAIQDHRYNITIPQNYTLDQVMKIVCSIHDNQYRREADDVIALY